MRSPQLVPRTCPLIFWLGSGCFLIDHLKVSQVGSQLAELGLKRFFKWILESQIVKSSSINHRAFKKNRLRPSRFRCSPRAVQQMTDMGRHAVFSDPS